jgi:hypothetical protein
MHTSPVPIVARGPAEFFSPRLPPASSPGHVGASSGGSNCHLRRLRSAPLIHGRHLQWVRKSQLTMCDSGDAVGQGGLRDRSSELRGESPPTSCAADAYNLIRCSVRRRVLSCWRSRASLFAACVRATRIPKHLTLAARPLVPFNRKPNCRISQDAVVTGIMIRGPEPRDEIVV